MNIQSLYENINAKISISLVEFELFADCFKAKSIRKKGKLIEEGKSNNKLFFVEKGLLYSYKQLDNDATQVIQFAKENYWISDLYSFLSASKALFTLLTLEDCEVWEISKTDLDKICNQHHLVETFYRLNIQNAYVSTLLRLSNVYSANAEEKYNEIRNVQPDLLQRVPQYLIASYLGILPSSLSRIRNKNKKRIS